MTEMIKKLDAVCTRIDADQARTILNFDFC